MMCVKMKLVHNHL